MHPQFFGDSFDLVKRFFGQELQAIGYKINMEPMFTGVWNGVEQEFFKLIGLRGSESSNFRHKRKALFIDPDTGVNEKGSNRHVSFQTLVARAEHHEIVFSFDQSFSRQAKSAAVITQKLASVTKLGCHGIYYDSHARFLFISKSAASLHEFKRHLVSTGLPESRLIESAA